MYVQKENCVCTTVYIQYTLVVVTVRFLAQVSQHRCGVEDTGCDGGSNGPGALGDADGGEINICGGIYTKNTTHTYIHIY